MAVGKCVKASIKLSGNRGESGMKVTDGSTIDKPLVTTPVLWRLDAQTLMTAKLSKQI
ncbi:hypothetical protein PIB30_100247, partial [Stylosanthes scabra]|nr:hypothetical protein [Stylosanthes scabra]